MHPAPHRAIPAPRASVAIWPLSPSPYAPPKITADRSPRCAASSTCPASAASGTPSSTRSTGPGSSARDGWHGVPPISPYLGLIRYVAGPAGLRATSATIRWPRVPPRGLAPTNATLRASSIACSAARASLVINAAGACGGWPSCRRSPPSPPACRGCRTRRRPRAWPSWRNKARHGRAVVGEAGGGAHVEQLLQGQLAVEDVAADQAVVVLQLVGADDVAVQDRALEVRRELVVAVDHAVSVGLQLALVRLEVPVDRDPLGEQRHDVVSLGDQRLVERRGDDPVAERALRRAAIAGVDERTLDVLHGRRHLDRAGVMLGQVRAWVGGEVGQL